MNANALDREGRDEDHVAPARDSQVPTPPRVKRGRRSQSNALITARNGGVRHQFTDSIGGNSANYR